MAQETPKPTMAIVPEAGRPVTDVSAGNVDMACGGLCVVLGPMSAEQLLALTGGGTCVVHALARDTATLEVWRNALRAEGPEAGLVHA